MSGRHEVTVELDHEDLWRFQRYIMLHEPLLRRRLAIPLAVGTGLAFAVLLVLTDLPLTVAAAAAAGTLPATATVVWFRIRRRFRRALEHSPGLLGRRTFHIGDRKLREHSSRGARAVRWDEVHGIGEDRHNLYILLSRTVGHPIPKRAFTDGRELARFRDAMYDRLERPGR